jgi:two-component system phosphate regulon sensor histidine kinase PhoR
MRRQRLFWHLYLSYFGIILFALLAVTLGAWWSLREFYYTLTRADLEARASLTAGMVAGRLTVEDLGFVDARSKEVGRVAATRVTVVLPSGQVIGDSDHDPATMDNHRNRPEIRRALDGQVGVMVRESATLREAMMYVAVPVIEDGQVRGVVRAAIPLIAYNGALSLLKTHLALELLVIALLSALISLVISRKISRPLEEARGAAQRFARGDLQHRVPVSGSREQAGLAEAMNAMAAELDERIRAISRQQAEQEAVLNSMVEGVLAIDGEERLLWLNQTAARLLGVDAETVRGWSIQQVVRNTDLQRFLDRVLASDGPLEMDLAFRIAGDPRDMQAHGAALRDEEGRRIGALVVLNDVTRLRRLETVRRDFVANVSHELKTPITSIKGFVETLLDGALQNPEDTERFLRIIARHADRMDAILEDLLALSRLEGQNGEAAMAMEAVPVGEVIAAALQSCESRAADRNIHIELTGDREVNIRANPALLEQAFVNLIDNAVKYSPPGSRVTVNVEQAGADTFIHIIDQGCGIAREHLPRIFERFYRVDTGRSRKLGGTGLGLAIVKHIAQVHQGAVAVDSTLGSGSTFTIHLPQPESGAPPEYR